MSGLAVRNKSGELLQYTGTQFEGLENTGTHHLCVRTGAGAGGVRKYGLTSAPLNDKYKALRMRIPDNAGGNGGRDAYIAQRYSTSASTSAARTYTASRVSNYVSSTTLRTASSSKLSTKNVTRVSTHAPIYYAGNPQRFTISSSLGAGISESSSGVHTFRNREGCFLHNCYSATTCKTSGELIGSYTIVSVAPISGTAIYSAFTFSVLQSGPNASWMPWYVTRTQTSRSSVYSVSSQTLSTASSSKLSTGNATRSSQYNTSSSMSTTSSKLTHNANL